MKRDKTNGVCAVEDMPMETEQTETVETDELTDEEIRAFFAAHPDARADAGRLAEQLAKAERFTREALMNAYVSVLTAKIKSQDELAEDEDFLNKHIYSSPTVKAAFREMFDREVGQATPITARGIAAMVGAKKPTTLFDAGEIAQKIL